MERPPGDAVQPAGGPGPGGSAGPRRPRGRRPPRPRTGLRLVELIASRAAAPRVSAGLTGLPQRGRPRVVIEWNRVNRADPGGIEWIRVRPGGIEWIRVRPGGFVGGVRIAVSGR
ncbi:hypothetical protein OG819_57755 [Streptomyces sp. NBC_01549]|uniref:hypothetical protein n=1 Tax=Streptomyces sp. NBC_01549 TaxID=2975874 RepID=UPI002254BB76|nr:hypothetical protein [Streptomyces sp. NBC_01549]MCX4598751.1 hypothetical protein [Streptomyces sp. NBC_01549]